MKYLDFKENVDVIFENLKLYILYVNFIFKKSKIKVSTKRGTGMMRGVGSLTGSF